MNKKFFEMLLNSPTTYVSGADLRCFLDGSHDSRYSIVKRTVKEGYLIPVKRDLYLIKGLNKPLVDTFEISAVIYGSSYVSFSSALSYHGWIPEAVRTTTCASVKRSKKFLTPIGVFSYTHIPIEAFQLGVEQYSQNIPTLLIAAPIKALADLIYSRKRTWATIEDLSEDLRIEVDNIKNSDKKLIEDLIENYPSKIVKDMLLMISKELLP